MTVHRNIRRSAIGLAILVAVTACDATGPTAPPEPQFATVYDLDVTTRYIKVMGSCDTNAFGTPSAGEFQYKYIVSGEGQTNTRQSSGYNTVTGTTYQKAAGGEINFTNRTFSWRGLTDTGAVSVKLHGAEWDGVVKDDRMKNRANSVTVPFKLGKSTREMGVGATSACAIRLVYYATWTERKIPAD
jgi:hypothetical protein